MVGRTPAGWYPEPTGRLGVERYFDGSTWTDQTRTTPVTFGPAATPDAGPTATQRTSVESASAATSPTTTRAAQSHQQTWNPVAATPQVSPPTAAPRPATPQAPAGQRLAPQSAGSSPFASTPAQTSAPTPSPGGRAGRPTAPTAPELIGDFRRDTSQSLLPHDPTFTLPARPTHAAPGWFPDPARSRKLRFYDGEGWTARTRVPLGESKRSLSPAAVAFRASMVARADDRAVRTQAGRRWRHVHHIIPSSRPAPSLHLAVRNRAGRVGGMMSLASLVTGLALSSVLGWQHFVAPQIADHAQAEMRTEITAELGGDLIDYGSDPAPIDLPTEYGGALSEDPTATADRPGKPGGEKSGSTGEPRRTRSRAPVSRPPTTTSTTPAATPADIRPWPPVGWEAPANRRARSVREFKVGAPVGRVVIPRIGVDEIMLAGTGDAQLARGVGVGTWGVLPGTPGNATLAAHRVGYGGPFNDVDQLRYGDQIIVEIPKQGRAVFEVRGHTIVSPHDTDAVRQTDGVRLTLTSCHPPGSVGARYIVQAELVGGDWLDYSTNRSRWRMVS